MKKSYLIPALTSVLCLISANVYAAGGHGGHGSSSQKAGKSSCKTTVIGHIKPKHLTVVYPESTFSFWIQGIKDDEIASVEVTAKKVPVTMTHEILTGVVKFKGKLPASLSNTAARIHVKVKAKRCSVEKGWLLKISE